jgi:cbb3-type cytochrome oxidase subunit 3
MISLFIVFGIVFIVVVFWIWKYKNWYNIKKVH